MKRRLKENIEIGDMVYAPKDEYQGTVIDIKGNRVLVDGPFGKKYHELNDLEKLGGHYEEDETPDFFNKYFTESRSKRKKIIRLTESDLTRIVKRIIKEGNENDLGLPHPNKTVYKELFFKKLSDAMSEVGTDAESIYDSLCLKLGDIMDNWRYESAEGGQFTWDDDQL